MNASADSAPGLAPQGRDIGEIALSDHDIIDAMRHIPGYLDVSTEDFRLIYHLAHDNAVERLLAGLRARNLLRKDITPLTAELPMDQAAARIAQSGYKGHRWSMPMTGWSAC